MDTNDRDQRNVIETASATTSEDNAQSGPFAYIITAVALGLLLLLSLAGAGCASLIITAVANDYPIDDWGDGPYYDDQDYFDYDTDTYDLDDWIDHYYRELGLLDDDSPSRDEGPSVVDVADALDFDIAPYSSSIDGEVSANSYAGTPAEVRDFVRLVVNTDRSYTTQVARCLDAAALSEDERNQQLADALNLCDEAREELSSLEVPSLQGDEDGEVKDLLGTALSDSVHRWELMASEVELLSATDTVNRNRLWNLDEEVLDATEVAGDGFMEAMAAASVL